MTKPTLLIVDDEKPTRDGLRAALEDRYDVYVTEDAATAMELLERENFAVLLTDFRLPNEDGMKLIARAKSLSKPPVCILMTAYGSEELAVQAMKGGADDYIAKGRMQIEELEMRIARAVRGQTLESEVVSLRHAFILNQAAQEPKELWVLPEGRHIDAAQSEAFRQRFLGYLEKVARPAPGNK